MGGRGGAGMGPGASVCQAHGPCGSRAAVPGRNAPPTLRRRPRPCPCVPRRVWPEDDEDEVQGLCSLVHHVTGGWAAAAGAGQGRRRVEGLRGPLCPSPAHPRVCTPARLRLLRRHQDAGPLLRWLPPRGRGPRKGRPAAADLPVWPLPLAALVPPLADPVRRACGGCPGCVHVGQGRPPPALPRPTPRPRPAPPRRLKGHALPHNSGLLAREGLSHPFIAGGPPLVQHAMVPDVLSSAFPTP